MGRPDFSKYVAHFCKDARPFNDQAAKEITGSAIERLCSILKERKVRAAPPPWTNSPVACFTECPWSSFEAHAEKYSAYGIGFDKKHVYAAGGGPAFYMRPKLYEELKQQATNSVVWPFVTPFVPFDAPEEEFDAWKALGGKTRIDYSKEREWRSPNDFTFEYADVAFITVGTADDLNALPPEAIAAVGQEYILHMDNLQRVETLWPAG